MIFFLINRFRRKKLRARESRQTAEDQRSIVGSIGYIAGNMGYMEGNLSSMDYTYGGAATHYPLWKPPSGYFPRGEAPPPYDEAVAISQAEALSAQCAAAAAAAQAAANQRVTMGMNTVELQNADMNRRAQANAQQMQQIQHHAQPQTALNQMNHQPTHIVPTTLQTHVLGPQSQQASNQSHQITQSTTNLINININSGGNITTIATGENHQPPYSLQDENATNVSLMQQQQSTALATQQMQMQQQQQQQLIAATTNGNNGQGPNGRVHIAQSNSICVQTMTPLNQNAQNQQQQLATAQNSGQSQIMAGNSNTLTRQPQNLVMASSSDCGYKNCHLSSNNSTNTVSRRLQRNPEPLQQYVVDVEVNVGNGSTRGYHSLPPCQSASPADLEVIASPTQFSNNTSTIANAISTPAIDQISSNTTNQNNEGSSNNPDSCVQSLTNSTQHNTLPLQHNQTTKSSSSNSPNVMKNSTSSSSSASSSKRYHRTMPRYYAVADPLTTRETLSTNALNTANQKSAKQEAKLTVNNLTNNSNTSSNNSSFSSSSKKPTCQCPVQHVPMSYMGSTQLTNAQNVSNNAFFTVLSNKLNSNSPSPSATSQQSAASSSHSQRLSNNSNTNSLNYQPRPKSSQSLAHSSSTREGISSESNTMKRSLNSHCNYEPKIATISTGELQNSTTANVSNTAQHHQQQSQQMQASQHHHHSHSHNHSHHGHHSSLLPPPQHHDDSSPIVLGRVTKRSSSSSSGDRLRSASSGSTRSSVAESVGITSPAAAAYLNSKVDAYLNFAHGTNHHLKANDLINPALPPKLHKSLTNLKATATTITATSSSSAGAAATSSSGLNTNNTNHRKNHNNNNNDNNLNITASNSNTTSTNCNNFSSSSSSSSGNNAPPTANTTSVQTIYTLSKPHHSSLTPNNTNLIGLTTSSTSLTNNSSSSPSSSSSHTNSAAVAAVSNLLQARKSEHDHIMKITQQQPPSLTLPLSTTSTISSFTSSTSKINSSTFYPLQNNVTYTLPKNIGGKISLNSTINSVVSKVPSVISLPSTSAGHNEHLNINCHGGGAQTGDHHSYHSSLHNNNHDIATNVALSKSTTLPKILRTKRDTSSSSSSHYNTSNNSGHNTTTNNTSSNQASSSTNTSNNYAVSQCSMPAYPKQYTSMSSTNNATNTTNSTSTSTQQQQSTHSHNSQTQQQQQHHQQPPTNINMQTQTITSTLAANYCPEDSHLNTHNSTNSNQSTTNNPSPHSSSSKQLPVCTTSKNCLNPKEHFLPNDTSLDDDYLSECENCKIAQSSKYYLDAEALASGPQETMTLQRKSMEECKEEPETGYYRISHTLPTNSKKNNPVKSNNREQWFSTIPAASSSSEEDINE